MSTRSQKSAGKSLGSQNGRNYTGKNSKSRARITTAIQPEIYTKHRIAEFLINNAMNAADNLQAQNAIRKLGLDPKHFQNP